MRNFTKLLLYIILLILLLSGILLFLQIRFCPPIYEDKTVIDIWNNSDSYINGMTITYDESEKVSIIPEIKPHERIIATITSSELPFLKAKAYLNYEGKECLLISELRNQGSTEARVEINKNHDINVEDLSYIWLRHKDKFHYKKFNRIVEIL